MTKSYTNGIGQEKDWSCSGRNNADEVVTLPESGLLGERYRETYARIVSSLKLSCRDAGRREDATSAAFAKVLIRLADGDKELTGARKTAGEWYGYLRSHARGELSHDTEHREKFSVYEKKASDDALLLNPQVSLLRHLDSSAKGAAAMEAFRRICDRHGIPWHNREAYERCYLYTERLAEVADELGTNPNAVYGAKSRIEKLLRSEGPAEFCRVRHEQFHSAA